VASHWESGLPTANSHISIAGVQDAAQVIYDAGELNLAGLNLLSGTTVVDTGNLQVTGQTNIANSATLTVNGNAYMPIGELNNAGTLNLTQGALAIQSGQQSGGYNLLANSQLNFMGDEHQFANTAFIGGLGNLAFIGANGLNLPEISVNEVLIDASGSVEQQGSLTSTKLQLSGADADYVLNNSSNDVDVITGAGKSLVFVNHTENTPKPLIVEDLSMENKLLIDNFGETRTQGEVVSTSGELRLVAHSPLTIDASSTVSAFNDVSLFAGDGTESDDILTIAGNVTSQQGSIEMLADTSNITGKLQARNGSVRLNNENLFSPTVFTDETSELLNTQQQDVYISLLDQLVSEGKKEWDFVTEEWVFMDEEDAKMTPLTQCR